MFSECRIGKGFTASLYWQVVCHELWLCPMADRFVCDPQQALVRMQLELLAGFLVYVGRTQYSKDLFAGRQGNRSRYHSTRTTNGFNDLFGRFIYQIVIVRL